MNPILSFRQMKLISLGEEIFVESLGWAEKRKNLKRDAKFQFQKIKRTIFQFHGSAPRLYRWRVDSFVFCSAIPARALALSRTFGHIAPAWFSGNFFT